MYTHVLLTSSSSRKRRGLKCIRRRNCRRTHTRVCVCHENWSAGGPNSGLLLESRREVLTTFRARVWLCVYMCVIPPACQALPTYMSMINTLSYVKDSTGSDPHPWAVWNRAWTAEENRHGDLLNKYLWVTGRVDMKMVERTTQILLGAGMDPGTDSNPYLGFVYTSFQERATKVSHGNTGFHAKRAGDSVLAKICGTIAADEARHEKAYCKIVDKFFELDQDQAMIAYARMIRQQITMPAHLMDDCFHMDNNNQRTLFADFSAVAENSGTYTAMDYADISDHLNKRWRVAERSGLSGEAAEAQEYVLKMPARIRKIAEKSYQRRKKSPKTAKFSWIYEREVGIW